MMPISSGAMTEDATLASRYTRLVPKALRCEQTWLETFRISAGVLIAWWCMQAAHSFDAAHTAAPTFGARGALSGLVTAWIDQVPPPVCFEVAAVLAGIIALGRGVPAAATLLGVVMAFTPAPSTSAVMFDLPILSFVSAWLVLLPVGRRMRLGAPARRELAATVSRTPELFVAHLGFVYANVFFWRGAFPQWGAVGWSLSLLTAAIPAVLITMPAGPQRTIAAGLQLALHASITARWGHFIPNALLATTSLVLLRRVAAEPIEDSARSATSRVVIDSAFACAAVWTLIVIVFVLGPWFGASDALERTADLLRALGPLVRVYAFR